MSEQERVRMRISWPFLQIVFWLAMTMFAVVYTLQAVGEI